MMTSPFLLGCKPFLLGRSLARNLAKPLISFYGIEWRERGYRKLAQIITAHGAPPVYGTSGKWKKSSIRNVLVILLGYLWVVELNIMNLFFKFTLKCKQSDIVPISCHWCHCKFADSVVDAVGKLPLVPLKPVEYLPLEALIPVANLPPVSTTPAVPVANLPLVLTPVKNLPSVSCKYLRKLKKIRNDHSFIFRSLGEDDS
jgi:hypothetical protein